MLDIVATIFIIALIIFTIAIMGLGIYVVYKMVKDF